jgi:hypothetical protein
MALGDRTASPARRWASPGPAAGIGRNLSTPAPIPWTMARLAKQTVLGGLVSVLGLSAPAAAQDLGSAVEWIQEAGAEEQVRGYAHAAEDADDHSALPMINSRDVVPGQALDQYRCADAPVDGFATMRTSGEQLWALRECQKQIWRQNELPGFVTLGDVRLSSREIAGWVEKASRETDVPAKLIDTIVSYVSGFRPGVVSERGHLGLMQLRPEVLAEMGIPHGDLLDPQENLRVGARYLRKLTFKYKSLKKALAAFRDGPQVVEAAGGKLPSDRRYLWFVREVMKIYYGSIREFPDEIGAESMRFVWEWLE